MASVWKGHPFEDAQRSRSFPAHGKLLPPWSAHRNAGMWCHWTETEHLPFLRSPRKGTADVWWPDTAGATHSQGIHCKTPPTCAEHGPGLLTLLILEKKDLSEFNPSKINNPWKQQVGKLPTFAWIILGRDPASARAVLPSICARAEGQAASDL